MIGALVVTALVISPVLADEEFGHTGSVGYHRLRDSASAGGAICSYKRVSPSPGGYSYEAKLKWIDVRPPKVRAIAGSQEVGWQFMVERVRQVANDTWVLRYTSPIQRDVTNASTNADFTLRGINVVLNTTSADEDPQYLYRVKVKMLWYRANGTIQGTATHLVSNYRQVWNNFPVFGTQTLTEEYPCPGWTAGDF
jgi:hypothetical protein